MKTKHIFSVIMIVLALVACNNKKEDVNAELQAETVPSQVNSEVKKISLTNEQYKLAEIEVGKIQLMTISDMVKLTELLKLLRKVGLRFQLRWEAILNRQVLFPVKWFLKAKS